MKNVINSIQFDDNKKLRSDHYEKNNILHNEYNQIASDRTIGSKNDNFYFNDKYFPNNTATVYHNKNDSNMLNQENLKAHLSKNEVI